MNEPPDPDRGTPEDAVPEPASNFDLTLLGTFRLTSDGRVVVLHEREQRVVALLAVRDRTMGRSALAGILWPDASDANALSSLRSALSRLPAPLREQLTVTPRDLTLSPDVDVDLRRARELAQQLVTSTAALPEPDDGRPAVILLSADLLPDWYEDWVVEDARQWHGVRTRSLESWSVRLLALGRFGEAVEAAIAAIAAEPLAQSGYASLIRANLAQGDRPAALRVLADYQRATGADRNARPPAALAALFSNSNDQDVTVPAQSTQSTQSVLRRARTAVAGEETEAFEVIASGISMEPSIRHGDTLVVSQHIALAPGRIVVATHSGVWIVKRLALRDGLLVLRSDNVDEEVPLDQVEVQGVVVQLHRNV